MRMVPRALVWLSLLVAGCHYGHHVFGGDGHPAGMDSGDTAEGDVDTDADSDTDTNGDTDTGTGVPTTLMDNPGDVAMWNADELNATIDLTDASRDESNEDETFYLVVVNGSTESLGYQLWYSDAQVASRPTVPAPPTSKSGASRAAGALPAELPVALPRFEMASPYSESDIGVASEEFHVRDNMDSASSYTVVQATLWAIGESVAIWVDDEVAIDWDYTCDGLIDQYSPYDSYGFDNCDLRDIAAIVDTNIYTNLAAIFGVPSDVNGDGRVTVLITPVLNNLPLTSADPEKWKSIVASYAEPAIDLTDYDPITNPGSDEQEIIYVFAPDPYGFYNPFYRTSVQQYTSMALTGQIAQMLEHLISYNYHVVTGGSPPEETWIDAGLGALAADLTGFGAVFYPEVWDYMDAPYLHPLTILADSSEVVPTEAKGAQYLFFRWLVDVYGSGVLSTLTQTTEVGVANVEAAVSAAAGTQVTMADLVLQWQMAMLTTGISKEKGGKDGDGASPLVDVTDWPPYAPASFIKAPPASPGAWYGANGYQVGINVRGDNLTMTNGISDTPTESAEERVRLGNTDHFTYVPGFSFYGHVANDYAAQIVRIADVSFPSTTVHLQGTSSGLYGAAVRWNDASFDDVAVEAIFSPTDANAVDLPVISRDVPVYAVGEISDQGPVDIASPDGEETIQYVRDTDRWRLDLSERASGEAVCALIWLDRHFSNTAGDVAPFDPWFAVLPERDVVTPTVGTYTSEACEGSLPFNYPYTVLDYLYYQIFLADQPFDESTVAGADDTGAPVSGSFDPCGSTVSDTGIDATCATDWDRDGVADEDEPRPATFLQQVWVQQCSLGTAAGTSPVYVDDSIFDADSRDDDSDPTCNRRLNAGGLSGDAGEEAYMQVDLRGGESYLVIVGGTGDKGTYEITLEQVDCDAL
jgi:hypothetical protein